MSATPQTWGRIQTMMEDPNVSPEAKEQLVEEFERAKKDLLERRRLEKLAEEQTKLVEQKTEELRRALQGQGGLMEAMTPLQNALDNLETVESFAKVGIDTLQLGITTAEVFANLNPFLKAVLFAASKGLDYLGGASVEDIAKGILAGQAKGGANALASKYISNIENTSTLYDLFSGGASALGQAQAVSEAASFSGLTTENFFQFKDAIMKNRSRIQQLVPGELDEQFSEVYRRLGKAERAQEELDSATSSLETTLSQIEAYEKDRQQAVASVKDALRSAGH